MSDIQPLQTSLPLSEQKRWSLWVASYPFFEASLLVTPPHGKERADFAIKLFDSDGAVVNDANLGVPGPFLLDLDPLLAGVKLESGVKYVHLQAEGPEGSEVRVRLGTRTGAAILSEGILVSAESSAFLPVMLSPERRTLLAVTNPEAEECSLRIRLFVGKRSPEITITVPPRGARLVELNSAFHGVINNEVPESAQAYIRIGARIGSSRVVSIEQSDGVKDSVLVSAL